MVELANNDKFASSQFLLNQQFLTRKKIKLMGTEDIHGVNVIVTITILAGMITIGSTLKVN